MRAARVHEHGRAPSVEDVPESERGPGQALVEVLAAPLNPVDLSIASGRFYAGAPPLPHSPGREGVGRVLEAEGIEAGALVYFDRAADGSGSFAERAPVEEARAVELPGGIDPALAACFGIAGLAAWLALEWRAELRSGETVLVLGASGAVGQIAVQSARLLGAGRVVAAARDEAGLRRARELGADATVSLTDPEGLSERLREAAGGLDVIVDPLWGEPAVAALRAANQGGRLVQIGQSAGAEATIPSAAVRGNILAILGHTNFAAPDELRRDAYLRMVGHAAAGELTIDRETVPLADVAAAWERQAGSPHRKLVLVP